MGTNVSGANSPYLLWRQSHRSCKQMGMGNTWLRNTCILKWSLINVCEYVCVCNTYITIYININTYAFFLFLSSKIFLGARDQVQGLIIARDVCFHWATSPTNIFLFKIDFKYYFKEDCKDISAVMSTFCFYRGPGSISQNLHTGL